MTKLVLLYVKDNLFKERNAGRCNTLYPNYISTALGTGRISVNIKEQSDASGKCLYFGTSIYYGQESNVCE